MYIECTCNVDVMYITSHEMFIQRTIYIQRIVDKMYTKYTCNVLLSLCTMYV